MADAGKAGIGGGRKNVRSVCGSRRNRRFERFGELRKLDLAGE
jgi:hypothetical protein